MSSNVKDLVSMFFKDLKQYNSTNFRTLEKSDLSVDDAVVHKSFSSVITRYFIFCEKHASEFSPTDLRMLYFQLKLDMVARYFSQYPASNTEELRAFQLELLQYKANSKDSDNSIAS